MLDCIIITYTDITGPGGLPDVIKRLAQDFSKYRTSDLNLFLYDLRDYFSVSSAGELSKVESELIPANQMHITIPWASPHKMIRHLISCKLNNTPNFIWPWGMFCRQQYQQHWNSGKKPLFLKRIYILFLKRLCLLLSDGFFMQSREEVSFSSLPTERCVLVTMGRPPSSILDGIDKIRKNLESDSFSNDGFSFVGRGQFREKGISKIVEYAKSASGLQKYFRFFCSSCDQDTQKHIDNNRTENLEWDLVTSGAGLVPHFFRSQAYITVSDNPIQLRTPYEALSLGTPVIAQAESMMEGFKRMFTHAGFPNAVRIVSPKEFQSGNFIPPEMEPCERLTMTRAAYDLLHPSVFVEWLENWSKAPKLPADFYSSREIEDACNRMKG